MDALGYVFLGVIAVATLAQTLVVASFAASARRAAARTDERLASLQEQLRPQMTRLGQLADSLSRIADGVEREMPHIQSTIGDATDRVKRTGEAVERVVQRPAGLLAAALAYSLARRYLARRAGRP